MAHPGVVLVVAVAPGRVIGLRGRLPWRIPEDLRRFKRLTVGHPVVMGRKTFESLGKALPDRTNIVVTRQAVYAAPGARIASTLDQALALAGQLDARAFVIGGADIFRIALPRAGEILATFVYARIEGDTFFPSLGPEWHLAEREDFESPPTGARAEPLRGSFVTLRRAEDPDACALCRLRAGQALPRGSPWDAGLAEVAASLLAPGEPAAS